MSEYRTLYLLEEPLSEKTRIYTLHEKPPENMLENSRIFEVSEEDAETLKEMKVIGVETYYRYM